MRLRPLASAAAILALALAAAPAAAEGAFLAEIDDLPLAPGLVEQPGGTLFDSPQGRIVDATAQGRLSVAEVRVFYDETLPELGWRRVGGSTFQRDREVLRIDFADGGPPLTVHFALTPRAVPDKSTPGDPTDDNKDKQP